MLPPTKYEPNDLPDILDFVFNEESYSKGLPDILKDRPYYLRVTGLLKFAKGYNFDKGQSLTTLASNVTGLVDRVNAVEKGIVKRPPEATQPPKDAANTTRANKHRR